MVDIAREVGADAVANGCTRNGNDQAIYKVLLTFMLDLYNRNVNNFISFDSYYRCVLSSHSLL